ncbi:unnamed protein product, partial [Closterium sp. NIES-53]
LDFFPSSADLSLLVRHGSTPFFVLVYVDDLVFATPDRHALASVKEELQRRHTYTDLGELQHYLGLQITRDRAARTITLTQSHMVEQFLTRFCFPFSKVQLTPLAVDHGLTAPPSDESFESSGPYPELVGCIIHRPSHWYAAKRVAKYVASTSGMGLVLGGKCQNVMVWGWRVGGGGCASSPASPPPPSPTAAAAAEGGGGGGWAEIAVLSSATPVVRRCASGSPVMPLRQSPMGPLLLPLVLAAEPVTPVVRRCASGSHSVRHSCCPCVCSFSRCLLSHFLSVQPPPPHLPSLVFACCADYTPLWLWGKQPVTLTGFSDSSWADDAETRQSTQGYSFSLGTGVVSWRSTRASSVSGSSCEAKVYAAAMAAQELRWLTFLLTDLGERPRSPPVLFADNRVCYILLSLLFPWSIFFTIVHLDRTEVHLPIDTSTATFPLLAAVDEPADEDVEEVPPSPSPPVPVAPPLVPELLVSTTGDDGNRVASPALASGIAGSQRAAKLVDVIVQPSTTGKQQTGDQVQKEAAEVPPTGERQTGKSTGELLTKEKSASGPTRGEQPVEGLTLAKQLVNHEDAKNEGELLAKEESMDSDVVEVPVEKLDLRRSGRSRKPLERLSFHACLPPAAFTTLLDDAEADVDLPELDPDAAMDKEICSLIGMGTWELVERPRVVNIMKNRWVLMTKYHIDDTVAREKACLFVKGFTQVYGADYDETYAPVNSYITLRIFLSIVAVLDLHLMQLDMKNAFLQSKLVRVLYMYQSDNYDDGTGWVCKLLKSLYGLK